MNNATTASQTPPAHPLGEAAGSGLVGLEIAAEQWPPDVMCRLLLPVPIKEMGAIATALGAIARKEGKTARMRQIGNVLELYTVPNVKIGDGGTPFASSHGSTSKKGQI